MPKHRKHCPKTSILPTPSDLFWEVYYKTTLEMLGGQRSRRYICIIYDILGIKCSQARVNNSRIKDLLGLFVPSIFAFMKKIFWKIYIKFFSKNVVGRAIFHFEQNYYPLYHIIYDTIVSYMKHLTFFTLMAEKINNIF